MHPRRPNPLIGKTIAGYRFYSNGSAFAMELELRFTDGSEAVFMVDFSPKCKGLYTPDTKVDAPAFTEFKLKSS